MPVTKKSRRLVADSDSDFTHFLYRCAAELFYRSSRVHAYVIELARSVSGDYLGLTTYLRERLRNSQSGTQLLIANAIAGPAAGRATDLFIALGNMGETFEGENERLAQLPPLHAKPEMFAIEEMFRFSRYRRRRKGKGSPEPREYSILLSGVFNAFEFEFDRGLAEPKNVLELGMCDFASPPAWSVLGHEIGHALNSKITPSPASWSVSRALPKLAKEWPAEHDILTNWAEEIFCDLVAAAVLGPAPMMALLSMERCTFGNRYTDFMVERDAEKVRFAHPQTHWRAMAVAEFLRHFGTHGYLVEESQEFERFAFERLHLQHPDEGAREYRRDRNLFEKFFVPIVGAIESRVLKLDLPHHAIDAEGLKRCDDRLERGYPIGAQGADRDMLDRELDAYFKDDRRRGIPQMYYAIAAKFDEKPLGLPTILLAAHRRRDAILKEYAADGLQLTREREVETLNEKLEALDRTTELSIRIAGVHEYWLSEGNRTPTRGEMSALAITPLPIHERGRGQLSPKVGEEGYLLSDFQILKRLIAKPDDAFFVSPLLDAVTQVGPSSLDVRLGTILKVTRVAGSTHLDLSDSAKELERQLDEYMRVHQIAPHESFVLHPGQFALATTLEYLRFPPDLAGRLEGRSTLARFGLQVHATAGFIDPGYAGTLTFELSNAGNLPIRIPPGYRLGQICLFRVDHVQVPYNRKLRRKYGDDPTGERPLVAKEAEIIARASTRRSRSRREE